MSKITRRGLLFSCGLMPMFGPRVSIAGTVTRDGFTVVATASGTISLLEEKDGWINCYVGDDVVKAFRENQPILTPARKSAIRLK